MRSEELKPCPFCGGEAELIDNRLGWYVSCDGCGSTVIGERALEPETEEESEQTDWSYYEQSAVQKWNTRHIPEGYKLAPIEPTEKMLDWLCMDRWVDGSGRSDRELKADWYKAMIEAAE